MNFKKRILVLLAACSLTAGCASDTGIFPDIGDNLASPLTIAINPATKRAYLNNSNNLVFYTSGSIQVLDLADPLKPSLVRTSAIQNFNGDLYLDTVNNYLYTTNRLSPSEVDTTNLPDRIYRINIDENSANFLAVDTYSADPNPFGLTFDPATTTLYAPTLHGELDAFDITSTPVLTSTKLYPMNLSTGYTVDTVDMREMAIIGSQAYITKSSGGLIIYDLTGKKADYIIADLNNPRDVVTDGTYLYVTDTETDSSGTYNHLYVLNLSAYPVLTGNLTVTVLSKADAGITVADITIGNNPQEIFLTTSYIFATNYDDNTVTVVNRSDFTVNKTLTVGQNPFGMALYNPLGVDTYLYVANVTSGSLSIIDIATLDIAGTYP